MSDIHQEWKDLRAKNGEFLNHLDCAMAKIEKEKVELKRREQKQDVADATAFATLFVAPPPFNCCQNDRDILKALNKAQADRIETLEKEIIARKEQQQVDLAVKKDLDKKLDKATADYRALWVENDNLNRSLARLQSQLDGAKAQCENTVENRQRISELSQEVINLKEQLANEKACNEALGKNAAKSYARLATERNNLAETVTKMEKTIRDLDERNGTLRERLAQTNASLKRSVQESNKIQADATYLDNLRRCQAKEIKRLHEIVDAVNGSCSASVQQGMQSKIAKQAAEIKRLTEENERLKRDSKYLVKDSKDNFERCKVLRKDNEDLKESLKIVVKDAEANFNRGRIKGMEEIWDELRDYYSGRPTGENEKIFGYCTVGEIVHNLSPTWFINRAEEYHEQEEKEKEKEDPVIFLGDEVEIFDQYDHSLSDIGIVIAIDKDNPCFAVIGPKFEGCFDETDIKAGNVMKTGRHFDSIPLDYFK